MNDKSNLSPVNKNVQVRFCLKVVFEILTLHWGDFGFTTSFHEMLLCALLLTRSKGQLISKDFFWCLPKNKQKQVDLRYHSTVGLFFSFIFWKNSGYQQVLPKLTDL